MTLLKNHGYSLMLRSAYRMIILLSIEWPQTRINEQTRQVVSIPPDQRTWMSVRGGIVSRMNFARASIISSHFILKLGSTAGIGNMLFSLSGEPVNVPVRSTIGQFKKRERARNLSFSHCPFFVMPKMNGNVPFHAIRDCPAWNFSDTGGSGP